MLASPAVFLNRQRSCGEYFINRCICFLKNYNSWNLGQVHNSLRVCVVLQVHRILQNYREVWVGHTLVQYSVVEAGPYIRLSRALLGQIMNSFSEREILLLFQPICSSVLFFLPVKHFFFLYPDRIFLKQLVPVASCWVAVHPCERSAPVFSVTTL